MIWFTRIMVPHHLRVLTIHRIRHQRQVHQRALCMLLTQQHRPRLHIISAHSRLHHQQRRLLFSRIMRYSIINSRFGFRDESNSNKTCSLLRKRRRRLSNTVMLLLLLLMMMMMMIKQQVRMNEKRKHSMYVCVSVVCLCVFLCFCSNLFSYVLKCVQWILYTLPHRCSLLHHSCSYSSTIPVCTA
jgi:K+-sensing histidine kinase KdpD